MAKTSYQLIPPELKTNYSKALQSGDRFIIPRVRRKTLFLSRRRKKNFTEKSLLVQLAPIWQALDISVQTAWNSAGLVSGLTGFKMFLKDTATRIKNDLSGYSTPSTIFQNLVGRIQIESPANKIKIAQLHPLTYWTSRKVRGKRDQFEPVQIVESFYLPLQIKISYNSQLIASGGTGEAKFFCEVYSHYQGRIITTLCNISIPLISGWATGTATISNVLGLVRGYSAFIEVKNAVGVLAFDNIELNHGGFNWARDPQCNDVNQAFTKAFYQIPKHWIDIDVPEGAQFESSFHTMI